MAMAEAEVIREKQPRGVDSWSLGVFCPASTPYGTMAVDRLHPCVLSIKSRAASLSDDV